MIASKVKIHRFRDFVAFHIDQEDGSGTETVYMDRLIAERFAAEIQRCAKDIHDVTFTASDYRGGDIKGE